MVCARITGFPFTYCKIPLSNKNDDRIYIFDLVYEGQKFFVDTCCSFIMRLRTRAILALIWIFIILYPNPFLFTTSLERLSDPPVNSDTHLSVENLPLDPKKIEEFVANYIEYEYDFEVYGVPWYIPAPSEVIEKGKGDCKSRAMLLASILEEKGIPYSFRISPVHFWVDYPGKKETNFTKKYENASNALYSDGEWKWPELMELQTYYDSWRSALWDSMPLMRKILLVGGLVLIAGWNRLIRIKS